MRVNTFMPNFTWILYVNIVLQRNHCLYSLKVVYFVRRGVKFYLGLLTIPIRFRL